jgi:type IV secretion system protein VirB10
MTLRERIQQLFENRKGSKGFWVIVVLLIIMVGWPVYSEVFLPRPQRKEAVKQVNYTTGLQAEIMAPPEPVLQQAPTPRPQAPRPQAAPAPRPVARKKQETEEQKMRRKARLMAHYAGPLQQAWLTNAGAANGASNGSHHQEPPQTLEVPPAQNGRNHSTNNGSGSLWKNDFYDRGNGQTGVLQPPQSEFMVMRGSVIPVELQDAIDTQTPGQVTARVIQDVKDSVTGRYTLIPRGSVVIGYHDTQLAYDQNRLPTAWDQLILPNGETMNLASFPGADQNGAAGIPVKVNNHTWKQFGRSLLLTLSGATADMARRSGYGGSEEYGFDDALSRQGGRELDRRTQQTWDRGGYRGPTGTAKAGEVFLLQVTESLRFPEGDYYERAGGMYADIQ